MDAASPHFVQNVKISGEPVAIIEPNGRIFPSLVKLPICPDAKASFPHALQCNLLFSIRTPLYVIYVNINIKKECAGKQLTSLFSLKINSLMLNYLPKRKSELLFFVIRRN